MAEQTIAEVLASVGLQMSSATEQEQRLAERVLIAERAKHTALADAAGVRTTLNALHRQIYEITGKRNMSADEALRAFAADANRMGGGGAEELRYLAAYRSLTPEQRKQGRYSPAVALALAIQAARAEGR